MLHALCLNWARTQGFIQIKTNHYKCIHILILRGEGKRDCHRMVRSFFIKITKIYTMQACIYGGRWDWCTLKLLKYSPLPQILQPWRNIWQLPYVMFFLSLKILIYIPWKLGSSEEDTIDVQVCVSVVSSRFVSAVSSRNTLNMPYYLAYKSPCL